MRALRFSITGFGASGRLAGRERATDQCRNNQDQRDTAEDDKKLFQWVHQESAAHSWRGRQRQ